MAQPNERVIDALATELRRRPALGEAFLRQLAVSVDGDLRSLSDRPFRVLYVFPARQRAAEMVHAEGASGRRRGRGGARADRKRTRKRSTAGSVAEAAGSNGRNGAGHVPVLAPRPRRGRGAAARGAEPAAARTARVTSPPDAPPAAAKPTTGSNGQARMDRARVRAALFAFAGEIAAAERPGQLVAAIGAMERHIDEAMTSTAA